MNYDDLIIGSIIGILITILFFLVYKVSDYLYLNITCKKCNKKIFNVSYIYYSRRFKNGNVRRRCVDHYLSGYHKHESKRSEYRFQLKNETTTERVVDKKGIVTIKKIYNHSEKTILFILKIKGLEDDLFSSRECGIYKLTNLKNQKVYIGQSISIHSRWRQHINSSGKTSDLYKAMQKDEFKFNIIVNCSQDKLNFLESYFIKFYNSYENGYNQTKGNQKYLSTNEKRTFFI